MRREEINKLYSWIRKRYSFLSFFDTCNARRGRKKNRKTGEKQSFIVQIIVTFRDDDGNHHNRTMDAMETIWHSKLLPHSSPLSDFPFFFFIQKKKERKKMAIFDFDGRERREEKEEEKDDGWVCVVTVIASGPRIKLCQKCQRNRPSLCVYKCAMFETRIIIW